MQITHRYHYLEDQAVVELTVPGDSFPTITVTATWHEYGIDLPTPKATISWSSRSNQTVQQVIAGIETQQIALQYAKNPDVLIREAKEDLEAKKAASKAAKAAKAARAAQVDWAIYWETVTGKLVKQEVFTGTLLEAEARCKALQAELGKSFTFARAS